MAESRNLHIVLFPWLAFGHIIPFLQLAKHLAQKGHRVSFASTPKNIKRLPKLPPNLAPLINLVNFPLPKVDNLPDGAEATNDVSYDKIQYLKQAYDGLQQPMTRFLETFAPDWVIYDFAPYWLPPIAANLGISRAFFCLFNASSVCSLGPASLMLEGDSRSKLEDFTVPPKWVTFPSNLAFHAFEAKKFLDIVQDNDSGVSDEFRFGKIISGSDVFAIRSCREFEADWLNLLAELHRKPILPIGLLPGSMQASRNEEPSWVDIRGWLENHGKGSVVYVALGSEITLSQDEITELALGLEQSGLPFFWALRKMPGAVELPEGFTDRIEGRGVVWTSWVPQLKILAHDSVGGFLTHCGWNSTIEGLEHGCALIMLPFATDQPLNARVLEQKGVGVEIPRDEQDGSLTRNSMADSLRLVMVKDEGKKFRDKAKEMEKIFGDKELHQKYLDGFVEYIQEHSPIQKG